MWQNKNKRERERLKKKTFIRGFFFFFRFCEIQSRWIIMSVRAGSVICNNNA